MRFLKTLAFAAMMVTGPALLLQPPRVIAGDSAPVHLTFEKCFNPDTGTYDGTVEGDCGNGTVSYVDLPPFFGKKTQHFSGEYTVTASGCSFKAVVSGMYNSQTGEIVLNGVVKEESLAYAGSRFHVRAVVISDTCTSGTMTITPR